MTRSQPATSSQAVPIPTLCTIAHFIKGCVVIRSSVWVVGERRDKEGALEVEYSSALEGLCPFQREFRTDGPMQTSIII